MKPIKRREFIGDASKIAFAASVLPHYSFAKDKRPASAIKTKLALIGTGDRGTYNWGKPVIEAYKDYVEMVSLCDISSKRLAASKSILGINAKNLYAKGFRFDDTGD